MMFTLVKPTYNPELPGYDPPELSEGSYYVTIYNNMVDCSIEDDINWFAIEDVNGTHSGEEVESMRKAGMAAKSVRVSMNSNQQTVI